MGSQATPKPPLPRATTTILPRGEKSASFAIEPANRSYKNQYSNIYFLRLQMLRGSVEAQAHERWKAIAGKPRLVPRVLDISKSLLCYIVGTVYMDMPLKPNVLEDIARDHSIPPPPPPAKYYSKDDNVMLEDASGRVRLVGDCIKNTRLVTGIIIGALGVENANGDFEVVDVCYAEMAPQASASPGDSMEVDVAPSTTDSTGDEWLAFVSGFEVGSPAASDALIQLLVEYLTGEAGTLGDQMSAAQISRLVIAGNSLEAVSLLERGDVAPSGDDRKARRYGYDATTFSPHPILSLSAHLLDIARVMPIHLLPGESDPSGVIMPQQPFPRAMFGDVAKLPTFYCETNPTYLHLATNTLPAIRRTILVNSGQPLNDMFKYLPSPPHTRLSTLESTLRWKHIAPTAPDTLWCHPTCVVDPFLLREMPDLYVVGAQEAFGTKLVVENADGGSAKRCRIVMVPSFARSGKLVLVNLRSLDVRCITFSERGMSGPHKNESKEEYARSPSPSSQQPMSSMPLSGGSPPM